MDPATAAVIAGGAVLSGITNMFSTSSQNASNMRLARYQNEWNLAQWHRENEYNSPLQTTQRLVEAGLSPRNVNHLSGFANSAQSPQAASYDYKSPASALNEMLPIAMNLASLSSSLETAESERIKNVSESYKNIKEGEKATSDAMRNVANIDDIEERRLMYWAEHQKQLHHEGYKVSRYDATSDTYGMPDYQRVTSKDDKLIPQYNSQLGKYRQEQIGHQENIRNIAYEEYRRKKREEDYAQGHWGFTSEKDIIDFGSQKVFDAIESVTSHWSKLFKYFGK